MRMWLPSPAWITFKGGSFDPTEAPRVEGMGRERPRRTADVAARHLPSLAQANLCGHWSF
ncbi:MAG: hypothetical protein IPN53_03245 [Comamonadaceae bacterium]|nr:hypothetical protein [Comamonadaceae bacterium]